MLQVFFHTYRVCESLVRHKASALLIYINNNFSETSFHQSGKITVFFWKWNKEPSPHITLYTLTTRHNNASLWNRTRVPARSHESWRWPKFHILSWAVVVVVFQHNSQRNFEPWQDFHHFLGRKKKKKYECSKSCKYFNYKNVFLFWDNIFSFKKLWG